MIRHQGQRYFSPGKIYRIFKRVIPNIKNHQKNTRKKHVIFSA